MFFRDIAGHKQIKENLIYTIKQNRMSHAWLFTGPEGNGKLALAIAYVQYLSCRNRSETDSCGTCSSCIKFQKLIHPDLHFAFPVVNTKKNNKPVSDDFLHNWREFILSSAYHGYNEWLNRIDVENRQAGIFSQESEEIIKKLNYKPFEAEFKSLIIWLPEKMNDSTANKLLKLIEEPPPKTLFILVSENTESIIKTILSRVQLIKIPKIDEASVRAVLKAESRQFSDDKINEIIRISEGNLSKAIFLLRNTEQEQSSENFLWFVDLMRNAFALKVDSLINWTDEISVAGREGQKSFLEYALQILRENFILNINPQNQNKIVFLTAEEKKFSEKFYKYIHSNNIYTIYDEFTEAYNHIERNGNGKLIFLDLALKLARLLKVKPNM
jgi:DNA polymerase-3 subunit delta'